MYIKQNYYLYFLWYFLTKLILFFLHSQQSALGFPFILAYIIFPKINITNDVAPIIKGVQDKEIKAGDVAKFNAGENLNGITGEDSKGNLLTVTVEGQVEIPDAGTNKVFEIKYLVKDKDGNETVKIRKVTVTNQVPRISGLKEIIIT